MTDTSTTLTGGDEEYPKSAPVDREINGPLDETEAGSIRPSVDLGALRIEPKRGMQLRLEIDKNNNRVIAVTLEHDGSTVQLQPFAAPRSSGLWHGIRAQIMEQVRKQGGTVSETEGPFGPEVSAKVPVQTGGSLGPAMFGLSESMDLDGSCEPSLAVPQQQTQKQQTSFTP